MFLEEGDIIRILETDACMSGKQIHIQASTPERTQTWLKTGLKRTDRSSIHRPKLVEVLREKIRFPWSASAETVIDDIDQLIKDGRTNDIHRRYAFLIESVADKFQAAASSQKALTREQWGIILTCLSYYTAMSFAAQEALATKETHNNFALAQSTALKHLASLRKHRWAQILIHRIESNGIGERWNSTPMALRDTPAMRSFIKETDYIGKAIAFHDDVAATDYRICFGPLSVASRFDWMEFYEPLWKRLKSADRRFEHPEMIDDPLFDDDFKNFLNWVSRQKGNT